MIANYIGIKKKINDIRLGLNRLFSHDVAQTNVPVTPNVTQPDEPSTATLDMMVLGQAGTVNSEDGNATAYQGNNVGLISTIRFVQPTNLTAMQSLTPEQRDIATFIKTYFDIDDKRKVDNRSMAETGAINHDQKFYANYQRLEELLGEEDAIKVVKTGSFLELKPEEVMQYLKLAEIAVNVILEKEDMQLDYINAFNSIVTLRSYLGINEATDLDFIELLREVVGIPSQKAVKIAASMPADNFASQYDELVSLLGNENALKVASEGKFLEMRQTDFPKYFARARIVQGKLLANLSDNQKPDIVITPDEVITQTIELFYSTESLEQYLRESNPIVSKVSSSPTFDVSGINAKNYPILGRNNALEGIVDRGQISFRYNNKSSGGKAPGSISRMKNVVEGIVSQVKGILTYLGINETPDYSVSFKAEKGNGVITFRNGTKKALMEFAEAYLVQNAGAYAR